MRNAEVYINADTKSDLAAAAKLLGMSTPDELAERWLSENLRKLPEIAERRQMLRAAASRAMDEWRAKYPEALSPERVAEAFNNTNRP